ncbi:hypothetical protein Tsp_03366 [Trichinella spiralis]|uniref:hypothetical protein n=1 Tax=Trichinella spiralis TaxID=6334 RepID=UPI0001EFCBB0|nr:hypothetical protein Tsp_03366 [Trichinella spiralis]
MNFIQGRVHGCGGYVYGTTVPPLLFPTTALLLGLQASRSTSSTLEPAVLICVCDFYPRWIVHSDPPSVVRTLRTACIFNFAILRQCTPTAHRTPTTTESEATSAYT